MSPRTKQIDFKSDGLKLVTRLDKTTKRHEEQHKIFSERIKQLKSQNKTLLVKVESEREELGKLQH